MLLSSSGFAKHLKTALLAEQTKPEGKEDMDQDGFQDVVRKTATDAAKKVAEEATAAGQTAAAKTVETLQKWARIRQPLQKWTLEVWVR